MMEITLFLFHFCLFVAFGGGEVKRPRGVSISKASLYDPSAHKDFTCLDGNGFISFDRVNDDYCDCADGSDEPGTSACPSGHFHCTNAGYKPRYIPSSRVNDGVCDCCDGTDEYNGKLTCANYCKELGRQFREELEKQRKISLEGHEIFKDYSNKGREARKEKQERLDIVIKEKAEWDEMKTAREELKNLAEAPEKEAKERHKNAWEEQKDKEKIQKNAEDCKKAFEDIDANKDGVITVEEMQQHMEFDIDSSGQVSPEEAKEYLEDRQQVTHEDFFASIWDHVKDIYKHSSEQVRKEEEKKEWIEGEERVDSEADKLRGDREAAFDDLDKHLKRYDDADASEPSDEDDMDEEDDDEEDEDDYYDDDDLDVHHEDDDFKDDKEDESMPEYDAETKRLIEAADVARESFREAEQKVKDLERELKDLETLMALDLGKHHEFFPLRGECYEYTDLEYTYKLCPFEKCSQRNKHGGIETSLGIWGHWAGDDGLIYSAMKYEKGQNCWHGPDRSCKVNMECGIHNELLKATEPNRCEYEFKFSTPAVCSTAPLEEEKDPFHDEL